MIGRLFRLPSIVYFVLAPIVLVLGIYAMITENGKDAERRAALSHDAPEITAVQDITSDESGSDFNEIVVAGQANVDNMLETTRSRRGRERSRTLFVPLYPTDAEDFSGEAIVLLEMDGYITDEQLVAMMLPEDGPAGPIMIANGVLESGINSKARDGFEGAITLSADARTVEPFLNGRETDLQPKDMGMTLLIAALVIAGLLGGYGYFRKRKEDAAKAEEQALYAEE
ncbi:MAG: hypothetical protein SXU28_05300 [Pseudomonadota bacterium]|nr:hypothetical protein [Pseudomonadota bacterium]